MLIFSYLVFLRTVFFSIADNIQIYENFKKLNISLIFFNSSSNQVPFKFQVCSWFVRNLWYFSEADSKETRTNHEQTQSKTPKRLLFECYLLGEIFIKKKENAPNKKPQLSLRFSSKLYQKNYASTFSAACFFTRSCCTLAGTNWQSLNFIENFALPPVNERKVEP